MLLSIIVAYARDKEGRYVIGKDNAIPWHLPRDLVRFRELTTGHAVVMGRKTFDSIGKPLPRRDNIIITHQKNYEVPGAQVFNDLQEALDFVAPIHSEVFIIGGQELYEQTLDKVDRMYITHIRKDGIEGDTFFPKWNRDLFKVIQEEKRNEETEFEILQRIVRTEGSSGEFEISGDMSYYFHGGGFGI